MYGLLTKCRRAERQLARERGSAPSFEEVASRLGLTDAQVEMVSRARRAAQLKLESSLGEHDGSWSPDESMDLSPSPEAALESWDENAEVMSRMDRLDDRERLVLTLHYGLGGESPLTLKEIGLRIGITREWVRKLELKAVAKMLASASSPAPRMPKRVPTITRHAAPLHGGRERSLASSAMPGEGGRQAG
jgi:RNA polymerase primary sigma factor